MLILSPEYNITTFIFNLEKLEKHKSNYVKLRCQTSENFDGCLFVFSFFSFFLEIDHKVKSSESYLLAYMNNFFSTLLVVPVCLSDIITAALASNDNCSSVGSQF